MYSHYREYPLRVGEGGQKSMALIFRRRTETSPVICLRVCVSKQKTVRIDV